MLCNPRKSQKLFLGKGFHRMFFILQRTTGPLRQSLPLQIVLLNSKPRIQAIINKSLRLTRIVK